MPRQDQHKWLRSGAFAAALGVIGLPVCADGLARYQALHDAANSIYPNLQDRASRGDDTANLIATAQAELGLPSVQLPPAMPVADPLPDGTLQLMDLRIALVQLAIYEGANDQLSIMLAQSAQSPRVIAVQGGEKSLADVREWLTAQPDTASLVDGDILRAPLVVLQGAALTLQPNDTLLLSRSDGAFLANFGMLLIDQAKIAGTAETNPNAPAFAPFVTTIGTGFVRASGAEIAALGFGGTALFSGFSVSNRGLYAALGRSIIQDSLFQDVSDLTLIGTEAARVSNTVFSGTATGGLTLRGARQTHVGGNLFINSGLRVTDRSNDNALSSNILLGSTSTGIAVARGSENNVIAENFIWDSAKTGINVTDSDCVLLMRNISISNRQKGMVLRASRQNAIVENDFLGNQSTGLFISNQIDGTDTMVSRNVFVGNRTGLGSSAANRLLLAGNDFSEQFPRFLGGDITMQAHQIIADLEGSQEIEISAGGVESYRAPAEACLWQRDS